MVWSSVVNWQTKQPWQKCDVIRKTATHSHISRERYGEEELQIPSNRHFDSRRREKSRYWTHLTTAKYCADPSKVEGTGRSSLMYAHDEKTLHVAIGRRGRRWSPAHWRRLRDDLSTGLRIVGDAAPRRALFCEQPPLHKTAQNNPAQIEVSADGQSQGFNWC
ncbi:hypothetical protein DL98DRAFT_541135 [Cadophora sp. DSE1049]|nr:hypothetical protein DL98DRAFT_541135 [Cadophora sp. DSE1049]